MKPGVNFFTVPLSPFRRPRRATAAAAAAGAATANARGRAGVGAGVGPGLRPEHREQQRWLPRFPPVPGLVAGGGGPLRAGWACRPRRGAAPHRAAPRQLLTPPTARGGRPSGRRPARRALRATPGPAQRRGRRRRRAPGPVPQAPLTPQPTPCPAPPRPASLSPGPAGPATSCCGATPERRATPFLRPSRVGVTAPSPPDKETCLL